MRTHGRDNHGSARANAIGRLSGNQISNQHALFAAPDGGDGALRPDNPSGIVTRGPESRGTRRIKSTEITISKNTGTNIRVPWRASRAGRAPSALVAS